MAVFTMLCSFNLVPELCRKLIYNVFYRRNEYA